MKRDQDEKGVMIKKGNDKRGKDEIPPKINTKTP